MPDIPPIRRKLVEEARAEELHDMPPVTVDDRPMFKGHKVGVPPGTQEQWRPIPPATPTVPQMKRGGMIRKTGIYMMHKGERVLPKSLARRYREAKHG